MSFGGFLENTTTSSTNPPSAVVGGGGRILAADIQPYTNNMPTSALTQPPRLLSPSLSKSMFNSPGLSLALVKFPIQSLYLYFILCFV